MNRKKFDKVLLQRLANAMRDPARFPQLPRVTAECGTCGASLDADFVERCSCPRCGVLPGNGIIFRPIRKLH